MTRKDIEYWGAGFPVLLEGFPAYLEDNEYVPDFPIEKLHLAIALLILRKPHLLSGDELYFLRATADITRSEFSRRIGKTRKTLISWESTREDPIPADPLIHLSLRVTFYSWFFPTAAITISELAPFKTVASPSPLRISYRDAQDLTETIQGYIGRTPMKNPKTSDVFIEKIVQRRSVIFEDTMPMDIAIKTYDFPVRPKSRLNWNHSVGVSRKQIYN